VTSVVHFTTVHPPIDGRIFQKECRTLAAAGYSVTLAARDTPDHAVDDVRFIRLDEVPGGRLRRAIEGNIRLTRLLLTERADVYHFHDPELLPLGLLLRLVGRRVVYDAHEHLRDDIRSKTYLSRWLRPIIGGVVGSLEWLMSRTASHVIAATPTIAAQFPPSRTTVVHNYPIIDEIPDGASSLAEYVERPPCGVYIGALSPLRHSREMFEAADLVNSRQPEFALVTAGTAFQVGDPASHAGVEYLGTVPRSSIPALLTAARFGVMLLADAPNCSDGLPTKFFEYAAGGLPVVVSRSTLGIARIVDDERCGLIVDERSPDEIATAMEWLLDNPAEAYEMGARGARAVRSRYRWEEETRGLLAAYDQVLGRSA
jgi:glycosyltransferase involved in cell wall biosynthesis